MPQPSSWWIVRHTLGRAFRETGQAMQRVALMGQQHAITTRHVGDDPYPFDDHLSRHRHQMPLIQRGGPIVSNQVAYLAPCSTLIGSVRIGKNVSVWYGAILRADKCENGSSFSNNSNNNNNNNNDDDDDANDNDNNMDVWELDPRREVYSSRSPNRWVGGGIFIGDDSNVQDGCIITSSVNHCEIGKGVTIGHLAQIHSATVEDYCLIGMGSILRENVVVETESFIAAGAVVAPGTRVPSGELWVGHPARKLRDLTAEEREKLHYQADEYVKVATNQAGVMELGGNVPDHLIEDAMLSAGGGEMKQETATTTQQQPKEKVEPPK
mmetsp:Transcript_6723/g.11119  ORF Transcript_6723/g.11119 Transcript_6723/m.11119 type:complete len:325 (-) Transcript_6723:29-1003(-)